MKKQFVLVALATSAIACQTKQETSTTLTSPDSTTVASTTVAEGPGESPDNFVVIPGRQVGVVRANSTEAGLRELLGAANVVRDTIYMAEGEFDIGTTLFKNTADQAQIIWKDKKRFARPEIVLLRPEYDENNELLTGTGGKTVQWTVPIGTAGSLSLGTSLREVERLNGKPFKLYGFGWDYGGLSSDWQRGKLQDTDGKTYLSAAFGVGAEFTGSESKMYDSVLGDGEFLSSNAAMQALNPTIKTLTISFR
ncbi:hypothetical protein FAES_0051 [Fibrella aestuarina BUZ 2]|uniref:Lipoprotein n=1 Tax=Fibrella aestuarina BUZ 2 TaxID=1166018 RepID=I0K1R2_9BACT|nr:hypothetical protein [Fibrella aestuarina]CCG98065.1 hypothetical protein FAES_0051 [Fibrella aestuarina BUZ 2]